MFAELCLIIFALLVKLAMWFVCLALKDVAVSPTLVFSSFSVAAFASYMILIKYCLKMQQFSIIVY